MPRTEPVHAFDHTVIGQRQSLVQGGLQVKPRVARASSSSIAVSLLSSCTPGDLRIWMHRWAEGPEWLSVRGFYVTEVQLTNANRAAQLSEGNCLEPDQTVLRVG